MTKQLKRIINQVLPAVAVGMGIAVIVISILNTEISVNDMVRLLAIGVFALGLLALNNIPEEQKEAG